MSDVQLVNELIGGPFDGRTWNASGPPPWSGRLVWGANRLGVPGLIFADYQFKNVDFEWIAGKPCYRFRYEFVGSHLPKRNWWRQLTRPFLQLVANGDPA